MSKYILIYGDSNIGGSRNFNIKGYTDSKKEALSILKNIEEIELNKKYPFEVETNFLEEHMTLNVYSFPLKGGKKWIKSYSFYELNSVKELL